MHFCDVCLDRQLTCNEVFNLVSRAHLDLQSGTGTSALAFGLSVQLNEGCQEDKEQQKAMIEIASGEGSCGYVLRGLECEKICRIF